VAALHAPLVALYYPDFEPDPAWMRAQLLFFDKVESIIPAEVKWTPDPVNDALFQKEPSVFAPIREIQYLSDDHPVDWPTLKRACKLIHEEFEASIGSNAQRSGAITPHHKSKLTERIYDTFLEYGLVWSPAKGSLTFGEGDADGFVHVDPRASSLIVGMIAEELAQRRGLRCVTPLSLPHYFNLCNGYRASARTEHEGALASLMIKFLIPTDIERMPLDRYLDIRDRHAGLRAIYRRFLKEACEEWDLSTITSPDALRSGVLDLAQRLSGAVEEERRKSGLKDVVKDWGTTLVSAGCRFLSLVPESNTKLIASGGMVAMQVLDKVTKGPDPGQFDRTIKMMATLKDDLTDRSTVSRLLGTGLLKPQGRTGN
jgi:hypothetical protein